MRSRSATLSTETLHGAVLAQGDPADLSVPLLALLRSRSDTGLVITAPNSVAVARAQQGLPGRVVVDPGWWRKHTATVAEPMHPALSGDGLFDTPIDAFVSDWHAAGADVTLLPSGFVPMDRWDVLSAVRDASRSCRPDALPHFALDASMLTADRVEGIAETLVALERQVAVSFAAPRQPLAPGNRMAALRSLVTLLPGVVVLATEPLVALDVAARGATAGVGMRSSLRHPRRPQDSGGGPLAQGWLPGLFLSELLEFRSPSTYADWYINSPSPRCHTCSRQLDLFSNSHADKASILLHNVHAWLDWTTEMRRRQGLGRRQGLLVQDRLDALDRHVLLHRRAPRHGADPLLRSLARLDDPQHRIVLSSGAFSA